jgi:hypothetical protein
MIMDKRHQPIVAYGFGNLIRMHNFVVVVVVLLFANKKDSSRRVVHFWDDGFLFAMILLLLEWLRLHLLLLELQLRRLV